MSEFTKDDLEELKKHPKLYKYYKKLKGKVSDSVIMDQIQRLADGMGRDIYNRDVKLGDLSYNCMNNRHLKCSGHFIMGGKKCMCHCHDKDIDPLTGKLK